MIGQFETITDLRRERLDDAGVVDGQEVIEEAIDSAAGRSMMRQLADCVSTNSWSLGSGLNHRAAGHPIEDFV